ncbi:hypothetical protein [Haloactinopolyspora alba]|uniref:hypothetical protein n=1 Tax=Haloactinopolyspora alba TaxID=648780 RepID=UPI0013EC349D|nr:hypothetical protein [Haloactinopolyspora alba]
MTVALAFVAGFMIGNGLPYYLEGSAGRGANPSPFPDSPHAAVAVGTIAIAVGATCAWLADIPARPVAGGVAFGLGWLAVGMIHAGNWTGDPWRKRARTTEP